MPLGAALLVFSCLSSSVPAHATMSAGGGTCLLTLTATFSGGVKATPTTSTMSWGTSSPTCVGTAGFATATLTGSASPPATVTCNSIAVSGDGDIKYDGLGVVEDNWQFVGGAGGGTIVLEPIGGIVVGTIELVSVDGLADCEVPSGMNFASQTTVTYIGLVTWAEVIPVS
jgi:hypothetical protein